MTGQKYSRCGHVIPRNMSICRLAYSHDGSHEYVGQESAEGKVILEILNLDRMIEGRGKYPSQ